MRKATTMKAFQARPEMQAQVTRGFVVVSVPLVDDDGTQRTIDFPRVGKVLHGTPWMHVTAKPYIDDARRVANAALREYAKSGF
jgi:hypothetical protein